MWVHFIIFMTAFGTVLVWKAGWLRLDGIADKEKLPFPSVSDRCRLWKSGRNGDDTDKWRQ